MANVTYSYDKSGQAVTHFKTMADLYLFCEIQFKSQTLHADINSVETVFSIASYGMSLGLSPDISIRNIQPTKSGKFSVFYKILQGLAQKAGIEITTEEDYALVEVKKGYPATPEVKARPAIPGRPGVPGKPAIPYQAAVPAKDGKPAIPEVKAAPEVPAIPEILAMPEVKAAPAKAAIPAKTDRRTTITFTRNGKVTKVSLFLSEIHVPNTTIWQDHCATMFWKTTLLKGLDRVASDIIGGLTETDLISHYD